MGLLEYARVTIAFANEKLFYVKMRMCPVFAGSVMDKFAMVFIVNSCPENGGV